MVVRALERELCSGLLFRGLLLVVLDGNGGMMAFAGHRAGNHGRDRTDTRNHLNTRYLLPHQEKWLVEGVNGPSSREESNRAWVDGRAPKQSRLQEGSVTMGTPQGRG